MRKLIVVLLGVLAVVAACTSLTVQGDATDVTDSGISGGEDAGEALDSGEPGDAGDLDAGDLDAGEPDAGDPEADAGAQPCTDVVDKTACGPGMKCTFVDEAFTTQCATAGTLGENAECVADEECAAGLYCVGDENGTLRCQAFCHTNTDCPKTTERCNVTLTGYTGGAILCANITTCDAVQQNCFDTGKACYPTGANGECTCQAAGETAIGQPCTYVNECVKGAACVGTAGNGVCRQLCDPHARPDKCPSPTHCGAFSGTTKVGACS